MARFGFPNLQFTGDEPFAAVPGELVFLGRVKSVTRLEELHGMDFALAAFIAPIAFGTPLVVIDGAIAVSTKVAATTFGAAVALGAKAVIRVNT